MAISFNEIPANIKVPGVYVEFDNTQANQGLAIQPYQVMLIGQRLSTGTKPELEQVQITSASQARDYFGAGSMLAKMAEKYFDVNSTTAVFAIAQDDDGAGVDATGDILFAGTPTAAGTLSVMIGGTRYRVAVATTDTAANVATNIVAEIQADDDRIVDAAVNGGTPEQMDLTARNAGEGGNEIDVRINYFAGEELPAGLTATITGMSGGSGNPDIAAALAIMTDDQFNILGIGYNDTSNINALETELENRWGPTTQNDGVAFLGKRDTFGNLSTLGNSRNSAHYSIMGIAGPNSPWDWAAQIAGLTALSGQADPARPFQTLEMQTILRPADSELFSFTERNLLLEDGISTYRIVANDVQIERLRTTYKLNDFGGTDESLSDVNRPLTLSYLRFSLRARLLQKFPRFKLANDGTRFGPGQAVVTPLVIKAECIALFREWEEAGLVENIDQFKRDIIVERNASDRTRVDMLLPPDLIDQMRVFAAQIQFRI